MPCCRPERRGPPAVIEPQPSERLLSNFEVDDATPLPIAFLLDGSGGAQELDFEGVKDWDPDDGFRWVFLDMKIPKHKEWLLAESPLNRAISKAMVTTQSRPRCTFFHSEPQTSSSGSTISPSQSPYDSFDSVRSVSSIDGVPVPKRVVSIALDVIDEVPKPADADSGSSCAPHTEGASVATEASDPLTAQRGSPALTLAQRTVVPPLLRRPSQNVAGGGSILLFLRGVNLKEGSDPDDMISVRSFINRFQVITVQVSDAPAFHALSDIGKALRAGEGPKSAGSFVVTLASSISERVQPVLDNLEEIIDMLEEKMEGTQDAQSFLQSQLGSMRRQAITLRRYMGPNRQAIAKLHNAVSGPKNSADKALWGEKSPTWLLEGHRHGLREVGEHETRHLEDLDMLRERAKMIQEELSSRLSEKMNKNMYIISIVTALFLPLGFVTGLLGINVGGMPGVVSPIAFWVVVAGLGVLALFLLISFGMCRMYRAGG